MCFFASPSDEGTDDEKQMMAIGALAVLAFITVTTDAKADPVGNPGFFEFQLNAGHDSLFRFDTGVQMLIDDSGTAYFEADLDGLGDISNVDSTFPAEFGALGGAIYGAGKQEKLWRPAEDGTGPVIPRAREGAANYFMPADDGGPVTPRSRARSAADRVFSDLRMTTRDL